MFNESFLGQAGRYMPPPLLTVPQAADYLAMSKSFLDKARVSGAGPTFTRFGRSIRYRPDVLDAWIAKNERISTSAQERAN